MFKHILLVEFLLILIFVKQKKKRSHCSIFCLLMLNLISEEEKKLF